MEYEKNICPIVDVDGVLECGKQFDLDITLPQDNRNVIYGIIRDCYKEPVRDAVVKLIEIAMSMVKKKESQFLILLQIKKENLYLDHYAQINSTL